MNELEGPSGVELARSAAEYGDTGRAFALAGRLLSAARLEGPVGQPEVTALWEMLRQHAARDPGAALRLVRGSPPASAGFAQGARALAEAAAAEVAKLPADTAAVCARAEALGFIHIDLLGLHIRALRSLGRPSEAERLEDRLHALAPLAVTDPVPSAFRAVP